MHSCGLLRNAWPVLTPEKMHENGRRPEGERTAMCTRSAARSMGRLGNGWGRKALGESTRQTTPPLEGTLSAPQRRAELVAKVAKDMVAQTRIRRG